MTHIPSALNQLGQTLGVGGAKPALTQREVARALCFAMLDTLKNDPRYERAISLTLDGTTETHTLYHWLGEILDVTYPAQVTPESEARYKLLTQAFGTQVRDETVRHASIKFLARVGHLHQLGGLMARDNLLKNVGGPSTAAAFLSGFRGSTKKKARAYGSAADAVAALNRPQFELTFTAHPTSTSSIASMQEQRELGQLLERWRTEPGLIGQVQHALQAYADTPILPMQSETEPRNINVREETDYMLYYLGNAYQDIAPVYASYDKALGERYREGYDPTQLKLNVKFHSWGSSGDKDGNKKVNGDTTLYAVAAHYYAALHRYKFALNQIKKLGEETGVEQPSAIHGWATRINAASGAAQATMDGLREVIDRGKHLSEADFARLARDLQDMVGKLDAASFGADLEAAYRAMPAGSPLRQAYLDLGRRFHTFGFTFGTIEYRETAEEYQRIVEALIPGYAGMDEPARQHALDSILSEPSQQQALATRLKTLGAGAAGKPYSADDVGPIAYQTLKRMELARDFPQMIQTQVLAECQRPSHMLEAQLLQHLAADAAGQRPALGIVPLFEDGMRLKSAPDIIRQTLDVPSYRTHLATVASRQGTQPTQQVQLAHSDNARRNGMPAARGLIYQAHEALRAMMTSYPDIRLQFYEGGSQSDPYRGGARAISATVNEFGIHDFTKMTYQGGDLLNYLNQPMSFFRLLTRNLSYSAAKLTEGRLGPQGGNPARDRKVVAALDTAKQDYVDLFEGKPINDFMKAIGYIEEASAGANGSRATARSASDEVDVVKIRTITYSEILQHAGLAPTWLGTLNLREALGKELPATRSPGGLHKAYLESPVLKDALDRVLFGVVRSDLDYLDKLSHHHPLMDKFRTEYAAALDLCYEAYTGEKAPKRSSPGEMRQMLIDRVYPHMQDVLGDQDRFLGLARGIKKNWLPEGGTNHHLQRQLLHNAIDTVYHGRLPLVDDPTYLSYYKGALGYATGQGQGQGASR